MFRKLRLCFFISLVGDLLISPSFVSAQWVEKSNSLYGGFITSLAVNGTNLFAGTGSGVFRSTDNGTSWTAVNTGLTNLQIQSLAVSGTNLFAGTFGGGVFRSTNNGTTWNAINTGLTNQQVQSLVVNGTNLFAGTSGGVFFSANNGASWTDVNAGLTNLQIESLAISGTNLFAGTYSDGLFLSTDNGTSWTAVNTGLTDLQIQSLAVSGTNLFAGTLGGLFLSANNGTSWTAVNTGLTNLNIVSLVVSGTNLFAGTGGGVFLSSNNGTSWTAVNIGLTNLNIGSLVVSGTNLFAGTYGNGVFLSTNSGASWTAVNTGITNLNILSLVVSGINLFAGTAGGGVFLSTDNGISWTAVNTGLTDLQIQSLAVSGTNLFAGTYGNGVFLSANNGTSWTAVNTGLTNLQIQSLAVSGTNLFALTFANGVFLSTNNGTSWTAVNTGLTNFNISSLAVSGTNLFAGTYGNGVFRFTNNGTSWTAVNTGITNLTILSLAGSGTNLFAGTIVLGSVFLSTNNGASWTSVSAGLTNQAVQSLAVSSTNLFAGTFSGGIYLSPDNGASWKVVNTGLTNLNISSLVVGGTNLFARTNAGKLWARALSDFPPGIASLSTAIGPVGTAVTITGTNFDPTPANNTVKFNGTAAIVTASTATSITTTVPSGATTGTITITVNGQTATSLTNFVIPPTISSFSPLSGSVGTSITISGTNFDPITANNIVKFNGTIATVTASTANSITTTVPAGATSGTITVTVTGQTATSSSSFIIPPTISVFNPIIGSIGTSVTITGANFAPVSTNNIVKFNGTTATVTASTATSITTTVPSEATSGPISVTVGGQTATSSANFTVDNTPPTIIDNTLSIIDAGNNITITAAITDIESTISSPSVIYRSISSGGTLTTLTLSLNSGNYTATIPSSSIGELGLEYKISASSSGGTYIDADFKSVKVNFVGNGLTVPYSSFGSELSNYRIVAAPLALNSKTINDVFADDLGPYDRPKWRMYRYDNGITSELSASTSVDPGQGYWLIAKSNTTIDTGPGTTVSTSSGAPFSVQLKADWNEIGNPYNFNISWADVQAANPGLPGLRIYNGDFTDGTKLHAMEGGFVKVSSARILVFPVLKNLTAQGGRTRETLTRLTNEIDQPNWQVYFNLQQGDLTNNISGFGMNEKASDHFDILDGFNMPRFFENFLELNHTKKEGNDFYSSDIVPPSENHEWNFNIESTSTEGLITLAWDNSYFGKSDKQLYLWDVSRQLGIDMLNHPSYTFDSKNSKLFRVVYGSENFVKEKISVSQLVLHNVWPNPATSDINLSFSLPDSFSNSNIEFSLFDILGKKTQVLQGYFGAGYHEVNLKSGDTKPGIYIINMQSTKESRQVRIVLK
jgi:hypothetical protein